MTVGPNLSNNSLRERGWKIRQLEPGVAVESLWVLPVVEVGLSVDVAIDGDGEVLVSLFPGAPLGDEARQLVETLCP
jgi:hypothetical protein